MATSGAENFSFHSPHHRVLKFAKRNGKFSLCFLLRTKINNAQLYWDWCNVYIPSAGDTLLYFGKVSDNNNFFLTNAYQGLFHLEDGNWTNQALITGSQTQQELLVTDLLNISGSSAVESPQTGISKTIDAITYTYPGSDYDTMISIPESALTEAIQKNISDAE